MSADGTTSGSLARYTPVPGTRGTPSSSVSTFAIGTAIPASAVFSSARPLRHVQKTRKSNVAIASGIQPPSATLVRLPARKVKSITSNRPNTTPTTGRDHFHSVAATYAPSTFVIPIVPITAAPYAADSASEFLNASTNATTATNSNPFTDGT